MPVEKVQNLDISWSYLMPLESLGFPFLKEFRDRLNPVCKNEMILGVVRNLHYIAVDRYKVQFTIRTKIYPFILYNTDNKAYL